MIAKSGRRLIHTMLRESSMPRIEGHLNVETESHYVTSFGGALHHLLSSI